MTLYWLLACAPAPGRDTGGGPVAVPDDDSWTVGEARSCPEPAARPTWTRKALEAEWPYHPDSGSLVLTLGGGEPKLRTAVSNLMMTWTLDGEVEVQEAKGPSMSSADLDGDGMEDLVFDGGTSVYVWWPDGSVDDLLACDARVQDAVVADFTGDGLLDLALVHVTAMSDGEQLLTLLTAAGERTYEATVFGPEELGPWGLPFDATAVDLDLDGDLDLYVCNDFGNDVQANLVVENVGGRFRRAPDQLGADVGLNCMGDSVGDLDHDGYPDLYLAASQQHMLLRGGPTGYIDSTVADGLPAFAPYQMGWGSQIVDLDNDGLPDLLVATSDFSPGLLTDREPLFFPSWAFFQQPDGGFLEEDIGLPTEGGGRAVLAHDVNQDGVVDLALLEWHQPPSWYLSEGCTEGSWLEVEAPPGTQVTVQAGDDTFRGWTELEPGGLGAMPPVLHLGLGPNEQIDRVELLLPDGSAALLEGPLPARRRLSWASR